MSYRSIDELQKTLSLDVFEHTNDAKKAAGRALGTIVEIITYYLLNEWELTSSVSIERGIEEYGNAEITHNVEFSIHPVSSNQIISIDDFEKKISVSKIARQLKLTSDFIVKNKYLIENGSVRNACVVAENDDKMVVAQLQNIEETKVNVNVAYQSKKPYVMFECKRVGVEEGAKKGPQTIEKAKQGAYVAKTISALQKVRGEKGEVLGLIYDNGQPIIKPYFELLNEIISEKDTIPTSFMLSVGVVSNHGNWFTADNQNKELKVLAQSYDWLLFLSDDGLAQFITDLLLMPQEEYKAIRKAFLASYKKDKKYNVFTKVRMDLEAHNALINYFHKNSEHIEQWFNVISPRSGTIQDLKNNLNKIIFKINKL